MDHASSIFTESALQDVEDPEDSVTEQSTSKQLPLTEINERLRPFYPSNYGLTGASNDDHDIGANADSNKSIDGSRPEHSQ